MSAASSPRSFASSLPVRPAVLLAVAVLSALTSPVHVVWSIVAGVPVAVLLGTVGMFFARSAPVPSARARVAFVTALAWLAGTLPYLVAAVGHLAFGIEG